MYNYILSEKYNPINWAKYQKRANYRTGTYHFPPPRHFSDGLAHISFFIGAPLIWFPLYDGTSSLEESSFKSEKNMCSICSLKLVWVWNQRIFHLKSLSATGELSNWFWRRQEKAKAGQQQLYTANLFFLGKGNWIYKPKKLTLATCGCALQISLS